MLWFEQGWNGGDGLSKVGMSKVGMLSLSCVFVRDGLPSVRPTRSHGPLRPRLSREPPPPAVDDRAVSHLSPVTELDHFAK
jgi:hypothetical protein